MSRLSGKTQVDDGNGIIRKRLGAEPSRRGVTYIKAYRGKSTELV